jgi:hypothetical protein
MGLWCQPSKTAEGEGTSWGTVEPASILGPQGWCNAAQPEAFCECYLDGGWVGGWVVLQGSAGHCSAEAIGATIALQ